MYLGSLTSSVTNYWHGNQLITVFLHAYMALDSFNMMLHVVYSKLFFFFLKPLWFGHVQKRCVIFDKLVSNVSMEKNILYICGLYTCGMINRFVLIFNLLIDFNK